MNEQIRAVLAALNRLEVRGEGNLNLLLGCIQTLNRLLARDSGAGDAEDSRD